MKYLLYLFLLFLPLEIYSFEWNGNWTAEARVAAFLPTEKKARKIYEEVWLDYQFEVGKIVSSNIELWGSLNYTNETGRSLGLHDKTRISITPSCLGVKYFFCSDFCFRPYIGLGVGASYLKMKDYSEYAKKNTSKWTFAALAKLGLQFDFSHCIFLDVFADYLYQEFTFHSSKKHDVRRYNTYLGGFKLGGGFGIDF